MKDEGAAVRRARPFTQRHFILHPSSFILPREGAMTQPEEIKYGIDGPWPVFTPVERRVLGTLIEKAKTSPDAYPMSLNALVAGCNQKSNRDPVMDLDETDCEAALNRLKSLGLTSKVASGRVEKWRHFVYEMWHVDKRELAILAELLLRGPQTEGELRTRASRMDAIPDLDALREFVKALVERKLAAYLTPEDRRGAVISHGFHPADELAALRRHHAAGPVSAAAPTPPPAVRPEDPRIPALEAAVARLTAELEAMRGELRALRQQLGG
jgi:uncharacterized protein YceH (UPF0502 family)